MNKKLSALIFVLLMLAGCIGHRVNLLEHDFITLKENVPTELRVNTDVFADDGNLVVLGRMSRSPLDKTPIFGHIDIVVLSASGEELATVIATFKNVRTWRHGPHPVAFRAEFPGTPPERSVVEVTYHTEKHK